MSATQKNPYVGPRTFLKEERHLFFGREREARDLYALVASDQLVLFYAQSGAGKSSLINTRLIPELEDKLYEVLPVARISGNWPEGPETPNIYIYNLIRSVIRHKTESSSLNHLSLAEFLAKLNEDESGYFYDSLMTTDIRGGEDFVPWRRVLIIDQFEELFSTHPEAWEKRDDFFKQLAQAMQEDAYLWVVLVMREDYIAALDPYAHLLPGGLRTRYYMQRLNHEAAIKAVKKPVEDIRPYEKGVAEKLVADLSRIKVQKPDGKQELQPGQYVEPVQLQVVCYGLWQNLPVAGSHITEKDLLEVGDVDEALGKYFEGRVAEVAAAKQVKERLIRDWIEKNLIAPGGIRSMVLRDTNRKSGGMRDDVIQALHSDLIRAENRGGTIWYELTHDRLVGPILANNKRWFDENLSPLQRQARLWNDQERNESWLLRDQALAEVEKWAAENPDELSELEAEFLKASREQQEEIALKQKEQMLSARRLRTFLAVVAVLAVIAVLAALSAFRSSAQARTDRDSAQQALSIAKTAEAAAIQAASIAETAQAEEVRQRQIAEIEQANALASADRALAGSLAAQADALKNNNYSLALLLGIEAIDRAPDNPQTLSTLFQLLQFTSYKQGFGFEAPVRSVAVSPTGEIIAASSGSEISLFDANLNSIGKIPEPIGIVYSLAFHRYDEELILAAGGCDPEGCSENSGQITIWKVTDSGTELIIQKQAHTALIKTIVFGPEGKLLASGSYDKTIHLWEMSELENPKILGDPLVGHFSFVNGLAFSLDGNTLISAGDDRSLLFWDTSTPSKTLLRRSLPRAHNAPINVIAFSSSDGSQFASASDDNSVILWDWSQDSRILRERVVLKRHTGYVKSIAFNGDGTILASAGFDNKIILWNTNTGEQIGPPLDMHTDAINTIAYGTKTVNGKESPYLASGSSDRTIVLWDLAIHQPLSITSESQAELPIQMEDSNGEYNATANGQQVDLKGARGETFLILDGFENPVQYVEFEGQDLRTVYQDQLGTSWSTHWTIDPKEWVRLACEAVGRNLTDGEWEQYLPNQNYEKTCEHNQ